MPLDLRSASSFFFPFFSFLGAPSFRRPFSIFVSVLRVPLFLSLSLLLPNVYSVCVAHVSHGICYVVHGIPAAATAAAADRLIRGPAPPLAFSFACSDILISPSRFSRSSSRPPSSSARTYACKNHNPATVRACVSPRAARVCASAMCERRITARFLSPSRVHPRVRYIR